MTQICLDICAKLHIYTYTHTHTYILYMTHGHATDVCQVMWFSFYFAWESMYTSICVFDYSIWNITSCEEPWRCYLYNHCIILKWHLTTIPLPSMLCHQVPAYMQQIHIFWSMWIKGKVVKIRNTSWTAHFTCSNKVCVNQGITTSCLTIQALGPKQNIKTKIQ